MRKLAVHEHRNPKPNCFGFGALQVFISPDHFLWKVTVRNDLARQSRHRLTLIFFQKLFWDEKT